MSHRYRHKPARPYYEEVKVKDLAEIKYAGCVEMGMILAWLKKHDELKWCQKLIACFEANTRSEFLAAVGLKEGVTEKDCIVPVMKTDPKKWSGHLEQAKEWHLIEEITADNIKSFEPLSYVRYFGVPKTEEEMRAITSARLLNLLIGAPPSFRLISHIVLLDLMGRFEEPHLATSDYKNHFYLFLLPRGAKGLFTIHCDGKEYVLLDIPMGFSWSPFWAEGFTSVVMYQAREMWAREKKAGEQPEIPSDCFEEYVVVTREVTKMVDVTHADGTTSQEKRVVREEVAFLTAVYDNILVIAKNKAIQDQLIAAINEANRIFNLKVKDQTKAGAVNGWFKNDADIFEDVPVKGEVVHQTRSRRNRAAEDKPRYRSLIYLGVEYIRKIGLKGVGYRHSLANIQCWRKEFEEMLKVIKALGYMTNRHSAEIGGVSVWDCRVSLNPLSVIAEILRMLSKIGKKMAQADPDITSDALWDQATYLTLDEQKQILDSYEELLQRLERREVIMRVPRAEKRSKTIYACSDSSGWRLAGMTLEENAGYEILVNKLWSEEDVHKHFRHTNTKETKAAIVTILKIAATVPDEERLDTVIVFGEDNTTALAALNTFYYPQDARLNGELLYLLEKLAGVSLAVFYVNTKIIPADDLTRDNPVDKGKCRKVHSQLKKDYADRGGNGVF